MISIKHLTFFPACLLALLCTSCEELIDLDLDDAPPVVVIEGGISNLDNQHFVHIHYSVPFSSEGNADPISGASVVLYERRGGSRVDEAGSYREVAPGIYRLGAFRPTPGRSYTLKVDYDNESYEATSFLNPPIAIDSIGTVENSVFSGDEKSVAVLFQDPPGEANYYRYLMRLNGEILTTIRVFDDRFNDGKLVQRTLFDFDNEFLRGDSVWIEQQSIDESVYRYLNDIRSNNPGTAAPANPRSNFSNGALGYFSAHGSVRVSTVVQ